MRNDYVVEWRVLLAEAGEADPDDHFCAGDEGARPEHRADVVVSAIGDSLGGWPEICRGIVT